jgi:hypothetical protein
MIGSVSSVSSAALAASAASVSSVGSGRLESARLGSEKRRNGSKELNESSGIATKTSRRLACHAVALGCDDSRTRRCSRSPSPHLQLTRHAFSDPLARFFSVSLFVHEFAIALVSCLSNFVAALDGAPNSLWHLSINEQAIVHGIKNRTMHAHGDEVGKLQSKKEKAIDLSITISVLLSRSPTRIP